ncbi:hypothetical protein ACOKM3_06555 [Streptomyces sp. BH106]|uniref:hypothetical protein n=1 Tax=Streptomyces sp. BH106 TaxID=3410409 RepID=UPI003CF7F3C7
MCVGVTQDGALESADRDSLALPADQVALIERVCAANSRTVVIVSAPPPTAPFPTPRAS